MRLIRFAFVLALLAGASTAFGGPSDTAGGCLGKSEAPSLELVYELSNREETVTSQARDRAMEIVCARLRAFGIAGGEVRSLSKRHVRVLLPPLQNAGDAQRVADKLGVTGQLRFYDWEASLIGPEQAIAGHPGRRPKASALNRAKREWTEAGRSIDQPPNKRLIRAGAFPNARAAAKLASAQKSRDTVIVSEQPSNNTGKPIAKAMPGWYVLEDSPALTGSDVVRPRQGLDEFGQPNVTFGFTDEGRRAFQRLTRTVALRGRREAGSRVTFWQAEKLSGHIAVVFDNEVKTRPIINFVSTPNGIDGRTGAQIAGGFTTTQEARDLATLLRAGAFPIKLTLIRQRKLLSRAH